MNLERTTHLGIHRARWTLLFLGAVSALAGCLSNVDAFKASTLPRAAFDLNCPQDQVTVTEFGYNAMGVQGCGRRATYVYVQGGPGWVNNSNGESK